MRDVKSRRSQTARVRAVDHGPDVFIGFPTSEGAMKRLRTSHRRTQPERRRLDRDLLWCLPGCSPAPLHYMHKVVTVLICSPAQSCHGRRASVDSDSEPAQLSLVAPLFSASCSDSDTPWDFNRDLSSPAASSAPSPGPFIHLHRRARPLYSTRRPERASGHATAASSDSSLPGSNRQ